MEEEPLPHDHQLLHVQLDESAGFTRHFRQTQVSGNRSLRLQRSQGEGQYHVERQRNGIVLVEEGLAFQRGEERG